MIKENDRVFIVPSDELIEMQLMDLAFRHGNIKEVCKNRFGIYGAWVSLIGNPYMDEQEWFIPIQSLHH